MITGTIQIITQNEHNELHYFKVICSNTEQCKLPAIIPSER